MVLGTCRVVVIVISAGPWSSNKWLARKTWLVHLVLLGGDVVSVVRRMWSQNRAAHRMRNVTRGVVYDLKCALQKLAYSTSTEVHALLHHFAQSLLI